MAVYRPSFKCPKCGKPYKSVHKDMGKNFVGDTFIKHDVEGHKCSPLDILINKVKQIRKK